MRSAGTVVKGGTEVRVMVVGKEDEEVGVSEGRRADYIVGFREAGVIVGKQKFRRECYRRRYVCTVRGRTAMTGLHIFFSCPRQRVAYLRKYLRTSWATV